jgi:hypothetical protein
LAELTMSLQFLMILRESLVEGEEEEYNILLLLHKLNLVFTHFKKHYLILGKDYSKILL